MRNSLILALATIVLMLSTAARAAPVEAVIAACDRTPGCSYNSAPDGSISGCSTHSGVCFDCDVKTRECNAVRTRGKTPIHATIGGIKLSPAPPKGKNPVGVSGVKAPNSGVMKSGGSNQPVTIERNNTQPSGGGGGGGKK